MPAKRCSLLTSSELSDKTLKAVMKMVRSESRHVKRSGQDKLVYKIRRGKRRQYRILLCTLLVILVLLYFYWKVHDNVSTPNGVALSQWSINSSRNTSDYVLPENFTTLLEPRDICRNDIFLLIIVCSNIDNIAARQNIRNTWGNTTEFNYYKFSQIHADFQGKYLEPSLKRLQYYRDYIIGNLNSNSRQQLNITSIPAIIPVRVAFFIGRRVHESFAYKEALRLLHSESNKYDDIIQENFIDNYINLTVKSVMILKWMTSRCLGSCAFIMKCNDDAFVNVPNLLHYLLGGTIPLYNEILHLNDKKGSYQMFAETNRLNQTRKVLVVHHFDNEQPFSDVTSQSYMPFNINDPYLSYLSGASYLMSSDVVPNLYVSALRTPLIYLEDKFITDICAKRIGLIAEHNPLFGLRSDSPCILKSSITQHRINNDALLHIYELVNDVSIKCAPPDELANNSLPHYLHNKTQDQKPCHGKNTSNNKRNGYRKITINKNLK